MFIIRILRLFRGYVTFVASGGFFERFLNLVSKRNISLWDMQTTPEEITGKVYARDYRVLAKFARQCGVRLRVRERFGFPFLTHKYRKRIGVFIGIIAFFVMIVVMQNFVWTLDIEGNERNSTERVSYVLQELGLRPGAFIPTLNIREIENKAVLELEHIAWFTINNYGSRIVVEMKETTDPPDIIDEDVAVNVIASKAGVIRKTEVYSGKSVIEVGNVVAKGDLLVSGVLDSNPNQVEFKHARAKIYAETYFDETFEVLKTETTKVNTGNQFERNYFVLFGCKIPLFLAFPLSGEYETSVINTPIHLFGVELPLSVQTLHYEEYKTETVTYDQESAKAKLNGIFTNYKETQLNEIQILNEEIEFIELEDRYQLKANFTCYENIALEQKLFQ